MTFSRPSLFMHKPST